MKPVINNDVETITAIYAANDYSIITLCVLIKTYLRAIGASLFTLIIFASLFAIGCTRLIEQPFGILVSSALSFNVVAVVFFICRYLQANRAGIKKIVHLAEQVEETIETCEHEMIPEFISPDFCNNNQCDSCPKTDQCLFVKIAVDLTITEVLFPDFKALSE